MGEPVSKFCEAVKNRQLNRVGVTGNGKRSINVTSLSIIQLVSINDIYENTVENFEIKPY